jgi:hypothetical protein
VSNKYEVRLVVRRLQGCDLVWEGIERVGDELERLMVEIKGKGSNAGAELTEEDDY